MDDVMVGGREISPSHLHETFELGDTLGVGWEFHPGGNRRTEICGRKGTHMSWSGNSGAKWITTAQMVVQEDYALQFKVHILHSKV